MNTRDDNGLTPLMKAFVREYTSDPELNGTEAFKKAKPSVKNDRTAQSAASRLLSDPMVKRAIDNILNRREIGDTRKVIVTRREILQDLRDISKNEKAPFPSRVRALELLGKHKGLFRDRHEVPGLTESDQEEDNVDLFISIRAIYERLRTAMVSGSCLPQDRNVELLGTAQAGQAEAEREADTGASSG